MIVFRFTMKTTYDSEIIRLLNAIKEGLKDKIVLQNTLTRQKDPLMPHNNRIDMFVCGPTVYNYAHIGHARSYVFYDALVKFFRHVGISVFYLQNITDIDDKIIKAANEKHVSWDEISRFFELAYFEDMKTLHVDSVNLYARATEHIPEIIQQVQILIDKGYAYETSDGIYFDVTKFPEYGKLSKQKLEDLKAGARVEVNQEKKHPWDFALWKFKKPNEPFWDAPFGAGRPGWHIEDTAIAMRYHGFQYDVHGGGIDLIFPHHESEIAQMEAISDKKPFVRIWLHNAFITVNQEKMSKSLGNFFTIRDVLKNYSPEQLRFFLLSTHYRTPLEFTPEILDAAVNRLNDLQRSVKLLWKIREDNDNIEIRDLILDYYKNFLYALADDFNTPKAFEELNKMFNIINTKVIKNKEAVNITKAVIEEVNSILNIFTFETEKINIVSIIDGILEIRNELRKEKLYKYGDKIRDLLQKNNIEVFDEKDKSTWVLKE